MIEQELKTYKFLIVTGKFSGMVPPIWLLLRSLFQYSTNDGQKDEYFALISDPTNLHINARFIGLRPSGRTRDFTWIQALGLVLPNNSHTFTVEATRSHKWEEEVDHLRFTYDDHPISLPEGHLSQWQSAGNEVAIERTAFKNSVTVDIEGVARILISVVPITEDDDRVHKYGVPKNDCFAHLEVQFEFLRTGPEVDININFPKLYRSPIICSLDSEDGENWRYLNGEHSDMALHSFLDDPPRVAAVSIGIPAVSHEIRVLGADRGKPKIGERMEVDQGFRV